MSMRLDRKEALRQPQGSEFADDGTDIGGMQLVPTLEEAEATADRFRQDVASDFGFDSTQETPVASPARPRRSSMVKRSVLTALRGRSEVQKQLNTLGGVGADTSAQGIAAQPQAEKQFTLEPLPAPPIETKAEPETKRPFFVPPVPTLPSLGGEVGKRIVAPVLRGVGRNLPLAAVNALRAASVFVPGEETAPISLVRDRGKKVPRPKFTEQSIVNTADKARQAILEKTEFIPEPPPEIARDPEQFIEWLQPERVWNAFWNNAPLTGVLAGATVLNPAVGTMLMAAVEGGSEKEAVDDYEKKTGQKLNSLQRRGIPIVVGAVNAALEKVGIDVILGKGVFGRAGRNAIARALITSSTEGVTETGQEIVSILGELGFDPNGAEDMKSRLQQAFYGGIVTGGVIGGVIPSQTTEETTGDVKSGSFGVSGDFGALSVPEIDIGDKTAEEFASRQPVEGDVLAPGDLKERRRAESAETRQAKKERKERILESATKPNVPENLTIDEEIEWLQHLGYSNDAIVRLSGEQRSDIVRNLIEPDEVLEPDVRKGQTSGTVQLPPEFTNLPEITDTAIPDEIIPPDDQGATTTEPATEGVTTDVVPEQEPEIIPEAEPVVPEVETIGRFTLEPIEGKPNARNIVDETGKVIRKNVPTKTALKDAETLARKDTVEVTRIKRKGKQFTVIRDGLGDIRLESVRKDKVGKPVETLPFSQKELESFQKRSEGSKQRAKARTEGKLFIDPSVLQSGLVPELEAIIGSNPKGRFGDIEGVFIGKNPITAKPVFDDKAKADADVSVPQRFKELTGGNGADLDNIVERAQQQILDIQNGNITFDKKSGKWIRTTEEAGQEQQFDPEFIEEQNALIAKSEELDQENKGALNELSRAVSVEFDVDVTPESFLLVEPKSELEKAAVKIGSVFGQKVLLVDPQVSEADGFNGFTTVNNIFLNRNSSNQHIAVIGHELTHRLNQEFPELFQSLVDVVNEDTEAFKKFRAERQDVFPKTPLETPEDIELITEQFIGDTVGERMSDPEFWEKMHEKSPSLVQKIKDLLNTILRKLSVSKDFKTSEFFKDIQKVRDVVDSTLTQFAEKKAGVEKVAAKKIEVQKTPVKKPKVGISEKQQLFITNKVGRLGSIGAVAKAFNTESAVDKFARETAAKRFGEVATEKKDALTAADKEVEDAEFKQHFFGKKGISQTEEDFEFVKKGQQESVDKAKAKRDKLQAESKPTEDIFIRLSTKKENTSPSAKSAAFISISSKKGFEAVFKQFGEQGKGFYYIKTKDGKAQLKRREPDKTTAMFPATDARTGEAIKAGDAVVILPNGETIAQKTFDKAQIAPSEQVSFLEATVTPESETEALIEDGRPVTNFAPPTLQETDQQNFFDDLDEQTSLFQRKRQRLELQQETKLQYLQRQIQDKLNRLNFYQQQIPNLSEESDAYMKAELFIGRAADKIEILEKDIVGGKDSFLKRLGDKGLDVSDMGEYLYAKHAKERNAEIQKKNPKFRQGDVLNDSGGSGITDEEANAVLEKYEGTGIDKFADEFYKKITKPALKIRLDGGLIDQELFDKLSGTYENYVPLKGKAGEKAYRSIGKGFSVGAKGIKRAFGRRSLADNPFVQAIMDYEDAVITAEKNRVGQSLLKLVRENPSDVWSWEKQQYVPRYDKNGELQFFDPKQKDADNVLSVYEDGKKILITMSDPAMAEGMKNLGAERGIKYLQNINAYLRAVNTTMNPEFIITNFERDIQTAGIHLAGEQSAKMAAKTVKDIPASMRGIMKNIRDGKPNEWSELYAEVKSLGGKVGWFDFSSLEEKEANFEKQIRRHRNTKDPRNVLRVAGKFINDINETVESGVRLAAYKNMIDSGISKDKAAQAAKNLTVNFNKKGNIGSIINSLWLFSNAGIQGSARIFKAMGVPGRPKTRGQRRVQKIVAGLTSAAFVQSFVNRLIGGDDYDKYSDWNKDNYWLFMTPGGKAISIKVPYGYNMFKVLGTVAEEAVFGDLTLGEAGIRMMNAANDAFNPLGGGSLPQFISPTAFDPFVQIAENKNFFGGPIKPDQPQFGARKPDSQLSFNSVRKPSKAFTTWLNRISGGTEKVAGAVDVSPETLDHFIDFFGGGAGKFVANTVETSTSIAKGEFPALNNVPMVRQTVKEPSEFKDRGVVRDMLNESKRTIFNSAQTARFNKSLDNLVKEKLIDSKEKRRRKFTFSKNQRMAKNSLKKQ